MRLHVSGHWQRAGAEGFAEVVLDCAAPRTEEDLREIRACCVRQIVDCTGFIVLSWHELPGE